METAKSEQILENKILNFEKNAILSLVKPKTRFSYHSENLICLFWSCIRGATKEGRLLFSNWRSETSRVKL